MLRLRAHSVNNVEMLHYRVMCWAGEIDNFFLYLSYHGKPPNHMGAGCLPDVRKCFDSVRGTLNHPCRTPRGRTPWRSLMGWDATYRRPGCYQSSGSGPLSATLDPRRPL